MRIRTSPPAAGFSLDGSLGFLVNQLGKKLAAEFNERLAEYGLTTTQWAVLACLWAEDGLAQRELSQRSGVDPATLTEMLKRMEARGLVRRARDPQNNRLQRVYLADQDTAPRNAIVSHAAAVNQQATADFSEAERTQLLGLLRRALANLDQSGSRQGAP
jgi:DNA-binding MarR family transcriptional regulator